jgi:putative hydrolase of the HAD superfamily
VIRAISLDLDDTLWPIAPAIEAAERALDDWLRAHCPDVAAAWPTEALRELRDRIWLAHPQHAHDFTTLRKLSLRAALEPHGYGEHHVEAAFEAFYAARNRVALYDDALPALARLSARWPIATLTNGNADIDRIGIGTHFVARVCARTTGSAKPEAAIFARAAAELGVPAGAVAHVGDDPELDVLGARRAGMVAVWLNRTGADWPHDLRPHIEIDSLAGLEPALDDWMARNPTVGRIA